MSPANIPTFAPKWLLCVLNAFGVLLLPLIIASFAFGHGGLGLGLCVVPAAAVFMYSMHCLITGRPPRGYRRLTIDLRKGIADTEADDRASRRLALRER